MPRYCRDWAPGDFSKYAVRLVGADVGAAFMDVDGSDIKKLTQDLLEKRGITPAKVKFLLKYVDRRAWIDDVLYS